MVAVLPSSSCLFNEIVIILLAIKVIKMKKDELCAPMTLNSFVELGYDAKKFYFQRVSYLIEFSGNFIELT